MPKRVKKLALRLAPKKLVPTLISKKGQPAIVSLSQTERGPECVFPHWRAKREAARKRGEGE